VSAVASEMVREIQGRLSLSNLAKASQLKSLSLKRLNTLFQPDITANKAWTWKASIKWWPKCHTALRHKQTVTRKLASSCELAPTQHNPIDSSCKSFKYTWDKLFSYACAFFHGLADQDLKDVVHLFFMVSVLHFNRSHIPRSEANDAGHCICE